MSKNKNSANCDKYKKYRNLLDLLIKKARYSFYENKIVKNVNNSRVFWSVTNEFLNNKKVSKTLPASLIGKNNVVINDDLSIANAFNDFFSSVGENLASKIKNKSNHVHFDSNPNSVV